MRRVSRVAVRILVVMGMAWAAGIASAQPAAGSEKAAEIPVEVLFKKAQNRSIVQSPDQRFLAAITNYKGRQNVVVVDLEKRASTLVTTFADVDVSRVVWANNERLLVTTGDSQGVEFRSDGGLFAVDRDGARPRTLVEPFLSKLSFVLRLTSVLGRIKGNTEEVLVSANDRDASTQDVYRMNVLSGRKKLLSFESPGKVLKWVLDADDVPRAALSVDAQQKRWWFSYLAADGKTWKTLAQWDAQLKNVVIPYAFSRSEPGQMIVASNTGRDTMAYFKFDPLTGKLGELIYGDDRCDVASFLLIGAPLGEGGGLIFGGSEEDPGKILGVGYYADKPKVVWFDEAAKKTQALLDAALPGSYNAFDVNRRRSIVLSRSDTNPGHYYVFDQDKRTLEDTGLDARPNIDPKQMQPMRPVSWTARDGLRIDGYLTLPRGYRAGSPVPLILHPHGGPWAKDNWEWNPEVQFMANRGFAVLQPNFRGSTGYGAQHLRLSYKHWGDTMIDDMIDGVEWAVKQGFADPNRLAVYGASYGGYATLQAMVLRPDLFKWGVNYVGVTDMTVHQDTQPAQLRGDFTELARELNGDQRADKALFEQQSPARHTDRIAAPVFHAYGGLDFNVDPANGRTIRSAFEKANKPYEWMFVGDEGHGYRQDANVVEFYKRFDAFMKKNTPPAP